MVTLVVDGILPFVIISIMNILIIRAIKQRFRELGTFNNGSASGSPRSAETGEKDFKTVETNNDPVVKREYRISHSQFFHPT